MINQANTKIVAMRYVSRIQIPLLFVILCQNIMHHSRASEIMNAAMTIYMYDREIYIIYHRATVASHTNQNFTISLVDLFDSTVISI